MKIRPSIAPRVFLFFPSQRSEKLDFSWSLAGFHVLLHLTFSQGTFRPGVEPPDLNPTLTNVADDELVGLQEVAGGLALLSLTTDG